MESTLIFVTTAAYRIMSNLDRNMTGMCRCKIEGLTVITQPMFWDSGPSIYVLDASLAYFSIFLNPVAHCLLLLFPITSSNLCTG